MVCRSPQRGEEALSAICKATGSQRVHLHACDMSDLSDIRRFARDFAGGGHRADTLINNAGGMAATVVRTREGAEQSFATNVLGTRPAQLRTRAASLMIRHIFLDARFAARHAVIMRFASTGLPHHHRIVGWNVAPRLLPLAFVTNSRLLRG